MRIEVFLRKTQKVPWFKAIVVLVAYAILAFFSLRGLLFRPGAIGHNWDWFVPLPTTYLTHLADTSVYVWKEYGLGYNDSLSIVQHFLFFSIVTSPGYLGFDGAFVSKALPFLSITISGTTMFYFIEDILRKNFNDAKVTNCGARFFSASLAGYFYALSPFLFNTMIGGSTAEFVAYSLVPYAVYLFGQLVQIQEQEKMKHLFLLALLLSLITICSQVWFLTSTIMILYALAHKNRCQLLKDLLRVGIVYSLLNLYWTLPAFLNMRGLVKLVSAQVKPDLFHNVKYNVPSILSVFVATGYFRPFFSMSIDPRIRFLWLLCSYGTVSFLMFLVLNKKNSTSLFWAILLLCSYVPATGGKNPLGGLVLWMYENIPPMILFRSPQHWMLLPTFCLATILGIGIFHSLIRTNVKTVVIFFILVTIWVSPFLTGDLGWSYLSSLGGGNNISTYQLSPGYEQVLDRINDSEEYYRILYLPMTYSPYYLKTEYQEEAQGRDPLIAFSVKPAVVAHSVQNPYAKEFSMVLEDMLCNESPPKSAAKMLALANVKYILLRKDVRPVHGPIARKWDYSLVYHNLERIDGVRLVQEYDYVTLWEIQSSLPHIYSATDIMLIDGKTEDIMNIVCSDNFSMNETVLLITSQLDPSRMQMIRSHNLTSYTQSAEIEFERINQTKYLVHVDSKGPFLLVFCESYDPGWKAYLNGEELSEHFVGNGYANVWYLDKTGYHQIVLEFLPQRWFFTGSMVSIAVLALCMTYLCKDRIMTLCKYCIERRVSHRLIVA